MIDAYFQTFEDYRQQNSFDGQPTALYAPVNYIMELGGKRLRPILALMGYELFKADYRPALPLAYAIEIFHNFSLVHDDVMDAAPLRRGQATVHTKWNLNAAILSGDVMLIYAYDYLLRLDAPNRIAEIVKVFNRVAREVCEGQQLDIDFETRSDVSIPEYLRMIELKTSVLIAGALEMAGLAAGASMDDVQHLYEFGRNVGIAFQLQDDILDTFGDAAEVGKQIGGDIVQNKKTYLILKALELADGPDRDALFELMNTPTTNVEAKIDQVKNILNHYNIRALTQRAKQEFQDQAFEHLGALSIPASNRVALESLAHNLLDRAY
ncbi:polyprenyl synthetase family protein [Haliscomenobacter hydrossis]|uniref:Geranyltranstransferase n=1 Tax=Haliscomenobacter hydrossis (strain ATCC 27775 / DSM 1100 / LMG 10767 / O) TaxID=760192 RepID=F4L1J5_HALH1|nr:polyprenyl synthetase family protein [Haliscomenobacter hydrossis]AEE48539.1 Geranyltranstransferase [Haliscomenobacter hydrossis DSM 1100]